ncbi:PREDICTED: uncharacterized protein LOC104613265 [Nelumbo nucifera]|uniref:Uncharacterized protein LOC104613265 n=2 Tax=Nelumbo nucifera TaxID=4432 RepID=A0A1U8BD31_NELNU|nr:PREDICTED: uncharacterized protein LOC104613265 [Nelumbo nucifera]XP_010279322.1 PREDICTED: uncharacterized protein LOC104613265 [Nelumbo nucifera]DAD33503.1 TPA_asm: hypothetical protein HUJ06_012354 [Nelumbo nucifera]
MVSSAARVSFRVVFFVLLLLVAFYIGRPLYWKISATIHEIREKRQTVKEGISQIVLEAQRSVGWVHDESDPGVSEDQRIGKTGVATTRRILQFVDAQRSQ